jgi:hypothetical protein
MNNQPQYTADKLPSKIDLRRGANPATTKKQNICIRRKVKGKIRETLHNEQERRKISNPYAAIKSEETKKINLKTENDILLILSDLQEYFENGK